jgi:phosphoribosylformylglycinamidine synthase
VALAETAFAGDLGMEIDLAMVPREGIDRDDFLLFSESPSRFVATVSPDHQAEFEEVLRGEDLNLPPLAFAAVGKVTAAPFLSLRGLTGRNLLKEGITDLKAAWQETLSF